MKKEPPNQYRRRSMGQWSSSDEDGMNGAFSVPLGNGVIANCIVSDGTGAQEAGFPAWEHVSVHILDGRWKLRTPSWKEMCQVKDVFWEPEECVVQFHPPHRDYINNHPHVLHLWRPLNQEIPRPPYQYVGIK